MIKENQAIIYLEMYLYKAKKIIIKRDCTLEDLEEAATYLNKCKYLVNNDDKETRIDVWFGKLELKRSRLSKNELDKKLSLKNAKDSFFMALNKKPTPSSYYGLFKIAIVEEDWKSAKTYLEEFEKSDKKRRYNFVLVHQLLDVSMGIEDEYPLVRSEYIFSKHIEYVPLKQNYRLAEESFCNKQYNKCLKHLLVCQKLVNMKSLSIDFSPLILLINKVIEVKNTCAIEEIKTKILKSNNSGEKIVLIRQLLKVKPDEVDLYFLLIESYMELGVYSCIPDILSELLKLDLDELSLKRIRYYENLSREQFQYSGKIISIFNDIKSGEENAANGDIQQAYNSFVCGLKNSGYSVFLSKLGDLFYSNGYYIQAEQYYLSYLTTGYENQFNVYVNLYKTYRRLSNLERASLIAKEAFTNLFLSTKGYTLETWYKQLEAEYNLELTNDESVDKKVKTMQEIPSQLT